MDGGTVRLTTPPLFEAAQDRHLGKLAGTEQTAPKQTSGTSPLAKVRHQTDQTPPEANKKIAT